MSGKTVIIVAPHGDDEIIGCFERINDLAEQGKSSLVLLPNSSDLPQWWWHENALQIRPVPRKMCHCYLDDEELRSPAVQWFFPDPVYEFHPEHRKYGAIGESFLRQGADVIFYSVNMTAPYIRETKDPGRKREMLELYYPDKASLWAHDHKYFLFEGHCKWIGGW